MEKAGESWWKRLLAKAGGKGWRKMMLGRKSWWKRLVKKAGLEKVGGNAGRLGAS